MTQLTASMRKSGRPTGCALNTARDLGGWVRQEMIREPPDVQHVLRVIARETDRWFRSGLAPQQIAGLAAQPARTGDRGAGTR